jgi:NAD(P)-dependent dehydrogenase (short-subunit alcohol dehydrogenase family)
MELKNKVVVITGGTKGLGRSMALSFQEEGARVVVCAKNEDGITLLPDGILAMKADVTKEDDLNKLLEFTVQNFGGVDIWVNNAGIWLPHDLAENFDMEKVRNMFEVNVFGLINGSRVSLRHMKEKRKGVIVNIISDSALASRPRSSMYSSSKWAVRGFTESIREENRNLSILGVYPGAIKTEIFGSSKPDNFDSFMTVEYVSNKIIENLKKDKIEEELIIQKE